MTNKLANNYLSKLMGYAAETSISNYCIINRLKEDYKELFTNIIKDNNQYLLTDAYLMFISDNSSSYAILNSFHKVGTIAIYQYLIRYYSRIINNIYLPANIVGNYQNFMKLLDNDTVKAANKVNDYCNYLEYTELESKNEIDIIFKASLVLLSYCHINNKMNEFETLYKKITNNYLQVADYIRNNNDDNTEWCSNGFINVALSYIDSNKTNKGIL